MNISSTTVVATLALGAIAAFSGLSSAEPALSNSPAAGTCVCGCPCGCCEAGSCNCTEDCPCPCDCGKGATRSCVTD